MLSYLTHAVRGLRPFFVEIGVESYRQCNTRFLAVTTAWTGIAVDSGSAHVDFLRESGLAWSNGVQGRVAFVEPRNVCDVVSGAPVDLGLLSVDIDGMDYWVVESLGHLRAGIVVVEYNSLFGAADAVTVPYREGFTRAGAEMSGVYYGSSLAAWHHLLGSRGYSLLGCTQHGNNAFFLRSDLPAPWPAVTPAEAYMPQAFGAGLRGQLPFEEAQARLDGMPVFDVIAGDVRPWTGRDARVRSS